MTRYYENSKHNAAFERCIDVMTKLLLKYGNKVLEQQTKEISVTASE